MFDPLSLHSQQLLEAYVPQAMPLFQQHDAHDNARYAR
jgi:hypothetical protein